MWHLQMMVIQRFICRIHNQILVDGLLAGRQALGFQFCQLVGEEIDKWDTYYDLRLRVEWNCLKWMFAIGILLEDTLALNVIACEIVKVKGSSPKSISKVAFNSVLKV